MVVTVPWFYMVTMESEHRSSFLHNMLLTEPLPQLLDLCLYIHFLFLAFPLMGGLYWLVYDILWEIERTLACILDKFETSLKTHLTIRPKPTVGLVAKHFLQHNQQWKTNKYSLYHLEFHFVLFLSLLVYWLSIIRALS